MFATGRKPNTAGIGLEAAGVKLAEDGAVVVDGYSQSSVPAHLCGRRRHQPRQSHAGGDPRGPCCSPTTLFGGKPVKIDHTDVPTAVFSEPEIGIIGLTEAQARAQLRRASTSTNRASGR